MSQIGRTKVEVVVVTDVAVNTTMPVDQATLVAEADQHKYGLWMILNILLEYLSCQCLCRINHNSSSYHIRDSLLLWKLVTT